MKDTADKNTSTKANKAASGGGADVPVLTGSLQTARTQLGINVTFFILYLAALSGFGSFVNDMYLPTLPRLEHFFGCSVPMVQMGLTMGMIGLGLGQLILGPVSDKYGRKSVLGWSLGAFCLAAFCCLFSPDIHFFIWCRLFQGLGASGAYFLARTIPADVYGGRALARTMAIIGAINGIAPACAPVLGGFIADAFDWQGVFVGLIIFAVVLLVISRRLKETLPAARRYTGSFFSAYGHYGKLLRNRAMMTHVILKGAALGILFAYISSAPFIMQTHFGYTQSGFGLIIGANALLVAAGSMVALKFKPLKTAALVGGIILAADMVALALVLFLYRHFLAYELLLLPMLFALGMIFTVSNTLAMNEGRADAGAASAIIGIAGYIFGAIVSPLVGFGDIMHSTAIVLLALTLIVLVFAILSYRLPADLM